MRKLISYFIAAIAFLAVPNMANAETDTTSGSFYLEGCSNFLNSSAKDMFVQGMCAGIINSAFFNSEFSGKCLPSKVAVGQAMRVYIEYLNKYPERQHENGLKLFNEAMSEAWPCKK